MAALAGTCEHQLAITGTDEKLLVAAAHPWLGLEPRSMSDSLAALRQLPNGLQTASRCTLAARRLDTHSIGVP